MDIIDQAEEYIWEFLDARGYVTRFISTWGTLDSLMNDNWTPTDIVNGEADNFIVDNIVDL